MQPSGRGPFSRGAGKPLLLVLMGLLVFMLSGLCDASCAEAQTPAQGRAHAHKASQLANKGKCHRAVEEYTKAYVILQDPAILFNRGECLRLLGRSKQALADYERFLAEMPKAPNREVVAQRIEALRKGAHPSATTPSGSVAASPVPAEKQTTAPIIDDEIGDEDEDAASEPSSPAPAPTWRPPGAADAALVKADRDDEDSSSSEGRGVPWGWIGLGAVAVAAGVLAAVLVLGNDETNIPESGLGNYKF